MRTMSRTVSFTVLLLATVLATAAIVSVRADNNEEVDLPGSMKPPVLDESAGSDFVDPRNLPPPEQTEAYRKMKEAMEQMQQAQDTCETPLGTELGSVHGVTAYSNCNDHHVTAHDHVYTTTIPDRRGAVTAVTGMKWQCVEFARRYLLKKFGVMFGDVMGAVDIWRFTSVQKFEDQSARLNLGRYRNHDDADRWPTPGSMVIWPIQEDMPFGHVAVIAEVVAIDEKDQAAPSKADEPRRVARVRIGDQNYRSTKWEQPEYTRELYLETYDGEYYGLADPDGYRTFGWMTYEPDIKPLDQWLHTDDDPGLPKASTPTVTAKFKGDDLPSQTPTVGEASGLDFLISPTPTPTVEKTVGMTVPPPSTPAEEEDEGEF